MSVTSAEVRQDGLRGPEMTLIFRLVSLVPASAGYAGLECPKDVKETSIRLEVLMLIPTLAKVGSAGLRCPEDFGDDWW